MDMFCYQCQEAAGGIGCSKAGVCGKKSNVANLQDLLLHVLRGYSTLNLIARENGLNKVENDRVVIEGLFATITNANFDANVFVKRIEKHLL